MNKFELLSSDGIQMLLAGGGARPEVGGWGSHVGCPERRGVGQKGLYSEIQCIMNSGRMGILPCGQNNR